MRSKNAVPISIFLAIALFIPILQLDNDDPRIFSAGKAQAAQKQLTVTSNAFTANSKIPVQYTGDGKDLSPPLTWSEPPSETRSFALTVEDPDAPRGTWFHWIAFDIPPSARRLKEGVLKQNEVPGGIKQGTNDFKKLGYNGPAPPKGAAHHYHFKIFALDKRLALNPGIDKTELYGAMKGHILATGELVGIYQR